MKLDSAHTVTPVSLFLDIVNAHFKHNRASSFELIVCLAQGGHLFRSATGEAGGVECQQNVRLATVVAQRDVFARVGGECEVRSLS